MSDHPFLQTKGALAPKVMNMPEPTVNGDLADRTGALAISPRSDNNKSASAVSPNLDALGLGTFPVQKSVWPSGYNSSQSNGTFSPESHNHTISSLEPSPVPPNRNTFTAFDVADRSFDKDPAVLKAEHAKVSPAVYHSSNTEARPHTHQEGVPSQGIEPNFAPANNLDTRPQADARPRAQNMAIPEVPAKSQARNNVVERVPDERAPASSSAAELSAQPAANNFAAQSQVPVDPDAQAVTQALLDARDQRQSAPDKYVPNGNDATTQVPQIREPEPEGHRGAAIAGAGAAGGLAAVAGAHALNSQPQQTGDYFGSKTVPASQSGPVLQDARAAPAVTVPQSSSTPASQSAIPQSATTGSFRRLSGQYVGGYSQQQQNAANGVPNGHTSSGTRHQRSLSEATRANTAANAQTLERPQLYDQPSRSYLNSPASPRTSYDRPLDNVQRRTSGRRSSRDGSSSKFIETSPNSHRPAQLTIPAPLGQDTRSDPYQRPASAHEPDYERRSSAQAEANGPFSRQRPASAMAAPIPREGSLRGGQNPHLSPTTSLRRERQRLPPISDEVGYAGVGAGTGLAIGEVATLGQQRQLQGGRTLYDDGPVPRTSMSPNGANVQRWSSFGHRPGPQIGDWAARREEGRLARSGTALSRTTVGRSGTQRSRRSGAFGRGAGLSVGTQPEDVMGREDVHERMDVSERVLSPQTLAKLGRMEKREGKQLAKLLKQEGKEQARAVQAAIHDLKRMARMQKEAIEQERKSQRNLARWTGRENRARMRFLKEKERYEKVEGELRNAENDYEERRDHAAGLTEQIAEKTQELDDLRAQKAADDREREVKLLAIKNPGHV